MINKIENLEALTNMEPSQSIINGLACIQLTIYVAMTGNKDLIEALENGR